jgi:hypothetical protein
MEDPMRDPEELCAYCDLHTNQTDWDFPEPACRQCLEVIRKHRPRHQTVEERRAWVRGMRNIPENNVTIISKPWAPNPFRMKRVRKWTYADRERLKR